VEQCIPQHELQQLLLDAPVAFAQAESAEGTEEVPPPQELRLDLMGRHGDITVLARVTPIELSEFEDRAVPMRFPNSTGVGRLLVLTDVTELSRTIKMKTDFVANASHELRTPVAAIRAAVETLLKLELPRDADFAKRFLEVIGRHSNRLEALAADLLALSRVESPAGRLQGAMLGVNSFCADLHERWRDALDSKELHWHCEVPNACHSIFANGYLLNLVLDNLVDNAIKFSERGGHVRVVWRREAGTYSIAVEDEGCGIPAHEHERVFERFYQAPSSKNLPAGVSGAVRGTGLGLSIVRHAVAAMGGVVRLVSEVGRGTTITFTVPQQSLREEMVI
jgi:two-component system phosphate regulon sensor histidine kinase PhoR